MMMTTRIGSMMIPFAGVMVAASIWSLIIPAMNQSEHMGKLAFFPAFVGVWGGFLFLLALEMILDVEIFKNTGPIKEATLVPLVFPLLAGAGSFTTLLSLRAEYAALNIVLALILNMVWVYIVLKMTGKVENLLGKGGIYLIRKFFGIILLAIAARLFTANVTQLIDQFQGVC